MANAHGLASSREDGAINNSPRYILSLSKMLRCENREGTPDYKKNKVE